MSIIQDTASAQEGGAKWQLEMPDKIEMYSFIAKGKFLLTQNWNRVNLHNVLTGKKEWETVVEDYEPKGVRQVINDAYYLRVREGVVCIGGMNGKRLWTARMKGIEQGDFIEAKQVSSALVSFTYKNVNLFSGETLTTTYLDPQTGNETYRTVKKGEQQTFQDSLGNPMSGTSVGTTNRTIELPKLKKSLRFFSDGKAVLCDAQGKELFAIKEAYPAIDWYRQMMRGFSQLGGLSSNVGSQAASNQAGMNAYGMSTNDDPPNFDRAIFPNTKGDLRNRFQADISDLRKFQKNADQYEFNTEGFDVMANLGAGKTAVNYFYVSPDEHYVVVILQHSVLLIDAVANKELVQVKTEPSLYDTRTIPTSKGCIVKGDKELTIIDFAKAQAVNISLENAGEPFSAEALKSGGKEYMLLSFAQPQTGIVHYAPMACVNVTESKLQWASGKDEADKDGRISHLIKFDGQQMILAVEQRLFIGFDGFQDVFVQKMDLETGKTVYKTRVGRRRLALSGNMSITYTPFGGSQPTTVMMPTGQMQLNSMNYSVRDNGDGKIFGVVHGGGPLVNPTNDAAGGDGAFMLDASTGKFIYQDYSDLTSINPIQRRFSVPPTALSGNRLLLPGVEKMVLLDMTTGKRLWTLGEPDVPKYFYPEFMHIVDDVLYVKFGKLGNVAFIEPAQNIFDTPKMKTHEFYNWWPFGFLAIDLKTGKVLWKHEAKGRFLGGPEDPSLFIPGYSLKDYYNPAKKLLYYVNYSTLVALQMRPDGGKVEWQVNLDENQIGGLYPDKMYALREDWLGSHVLGYSASFLLTATPEEKAASRRRAEEAAASMVYIHPLFLNRMRVSAVPCLKANYNGKDILIYGEKGLALVDPAKGNVRWKQAWNYYPLGVQYVPSVIGKNLVYCVDNSFTCLDVESGAVKWSAKEWDKPQFFLSPDESLILTLRDKTLKAYPLMK